MDEVLTKKDIKALNKEDLQNYAFKMSNSYRDLYTKLFEKNKGVISQLQDQLSIAANTNKILLAKVINIEKLSYGNAQYARKETIEFHGFNTDIDDKAMEGKVLQVINSIKEEDQPEFKSSDIQACHKLRNKKIVICKFVSRKRMRSVVNTRKKLKDKDLKAYGVAGKLFISESMSFPYKNIDWKCRLLKKAQRIHQCCFLMVHTTYK